MLSRLNAAMLAAAALATAGCSEALSSDGAPAAPTGLYYQLEPSGDPARPRGVILRWDAVDDPRLAVYNVYSRGGSSEPFGLRGSTTSPSFHDDGVPHLEYYVTAASGDGLESAPSASVVIDERLRLPAPSTLTSISLDGAIHLEWADNAFAADPNGFWHYRVYSASYDLDHNLCGTGWALEGTTVASTFLAANLVNGRPRCFGVSAVSVEGFESLWSPLRYDTPRPDGADVAVFTQAADPLRSGFRFWVDANNDGLVGPLELGIVGSAGSGAMDFVVEQNTSGQLLLVPQRSAVEVQQYGTEPIHDLTEIDIAPSGGYARTGLVATPRFGYVFQINGGDGFYRYGAVRVAAIGTDYVIFDWSYQTDPGNPELIRVSP